VSVWNKSLHDYSRYSAQEILVVEAMYRPAFNAINRLPAYTYFRALISKLKASSLVLHTPKKRQAPGSVLDRSGRITHRVRTEKTTGYYKVTPSGPDATSLFPDVLVGVPCDCDKLDIRSWMTFMVLQGLIASYRRSIYGTRHASHKTCEGRRGH